MKKFALVGNPNSGKTTLFNSLTGSTAHVGNWPGVTVDKKEGVYKKASEPVQIIDLPGIYSLSPYTDEEVVSRNFILDQKPDCVINIVDATNLERNLYLTTQIMEIDVPIVIALNMMDEVEKNGDKINVKALEEAMGLRVIPISALKEQGLKELMEAAIGECAIGRNATTVLQDTALIHLIGDCSIGMQGAGVDNPLFHAVKLVESDELEIKNHPQASKMVDEFRKTFVDDKFAGDFEALIADARYRFITDRMHGILKKNVNSQTVTKMEQANKIDRVLTHKVWGIPIFLVIMFAIFHLTFSENFLFIGGLLPEGWVSCQGTAFEGVFGDGGINSIGVVLQGLMEVATTAIGDAIRSAMESGEVAEWAVGFVCDGILGGLFSILSFLPQILVLFLFFSILEDSGYMARVAFILDKIFKKFGLSGRAFIPMIMGFGCSVPAMINTRTLSDKKEKVATIRVIPFFSCGAKVPILTAIAGAIVMKFGVGNADLITYAMYLLGILVALLSVILMRKTTMQGESSPFIMELPAYRRPQFKNTMLLLWDKAKHFITKAFTIILASTIVIWFVSHFSFSWKFLEDEGINESILAGIGQLVQPIFTPLGFGSQAGAFGWVFAVAAITGLIAKENVIATFGTLAACIVSGFVANDALEGVDSVVQMIEMTGVTIPALIAFIAFNMLTIPCFAAVATAKAELNFDHAFRNTIIYWICASYLVSTAIYLIGTYWWTVFIFATLVAVTVTLVVLYDKGKIKLPIRRKV